MRITACYIVKNEEKTLKKSLDSIKSAVDEIIVVDTGSQDKTVKIAKKYKAKVYEIPWKDDFSAARNFALEKASGDWIVFLDADEYFSSASAKNLRKLIKQKHNEGHRGTIFIRRYDIDIDNNDELLADTLVIRIFYNRSTYRYVGSIHEELMNNGKIIQETTVIPPSILCLFHTGYSRQFSGAKAQRNLRLLLQELETTERPERLYVFLADAYLGIEDDDNAWRYASLDVKNGRGNSTYASRSYRILLQLAFKRKMPLNEQLLLCRDAVRDFPEIPEFHAQLAECLATKGEYLSAACEMENAINTYNNYSGIEPMLMDKNMVKQAEVCLTKWRTMAKDFNGGDSGIVDKEQYIIDGKKSVKANISVIIPVWNNLLVLKNCLSLLRLFGKGYIREIIIIDNGSNADTVKWLSLQPDISLIRNRHNLGAAVAFNQGAAKAAGEYMLFMHSDVFVTPDVIANTIKIMMQDAKLGIVGVYTNRASQGWQSLKVNGEYNSIETMLEYATSRDKGQSSDKHTMVIEDFFMLVRSEAYKKIEGFDEKYTYSSLEDYDFSLRMHMAGYHCYLANEFVHHDTDSYQSNNCVKNDILLDNWKYFKDIWQTDPKYSIIVRGDVLRFVDVGRENVHILDVGCACGANLMAIALNNPTAHLYGIEVNEKTAAVAACYANVQAVDIEKVEYNDWNEKFDYIICADVLEHLKNPWQAMRNLARFLKREGKMVISLPNIGHISIISGLLQGDWNYREAGLLDRTHLRFFTKKTAVEMLKYAALDVISLEPVLLMPDKDDVTAIYNKIIEHNINTIPQEEMLTYQWLIVAGKKNG